MPNPENDFETNKNPKEPQPERKVPEFIYVEDSKHDEKEIGSTPHDPGHVFGSIQSISKGKQPFYLRVLAFFGTLIMIVLSLVVFAVWFLFGILSLIFIRQSKSMNDQAAISWKSLKKALVFTLGCFVCIFNLSLGVGIVLMYFLLTGEKFDARYVQEFTNRR